MSQLRLQLGPLTKSNLKKNYYSGFSIETGFMYAHACTCMHICEEIYCKELSQMAVMEFDKSHDLSSARRRPRKASGIIQSEY